jgi:hypothetical protein
VWKRLGSPYVSGRSRPGSRARTPPRQPSSAKPKKIGEENARGKRQLLTSVSHEDHWQMPQVSSPDILKIPGERAHLVPETTSQWERLSFHRSWSRVISAVVMATLRSGWSRLGTFRRYAISTKRSLFGEALTLGATVVMELLGQCLAHSRRQLLRMRPWVPRASARSRV